MDKVIFVHGRQAQAQAQAQALADGRSKGLDGRGMHDADCGPPPAAAAVFASTGAAWQDAAAAAEPVSRNPTSHPDLAAEHAKQPLRQPPSQSDIPPRQAARPRTAGAGVLRTIHSDLAAHVSSCKNDIARWGPGSQG